MNFAEGNLLVLFLMFAAWGLGGWLLARQAFALYHRERLLIGAALGIVLANWLANLLAQVIELPYAFWLSAFLLVLAGILASRPLDIRALLFEIRIALPYLGLLAILAFVFTMIGRGLAIFDEFQTIPLVSLMAAGKIPTRFVLNPEIHFGYHYFLLLFAAQVVRLGDVFPWMALDLARSITLAFTLLLGALWAYRVTRQALVASLTAILLAFATGARWLLLLLPGRLLEYVSESVQLIGSAAVTGDSLRQAIISPWRIEGGGPIPYPFVFADGISHPYVMTLNGIGTMAVLIMILLLLTADRSRGILSGILLVICVSSLALANEVAFGLLYLSFLAVMAISLLRGKFATQPVRLWFGLGVLVVGGIVTIVQGGMFTEMARSLLGRLMGQPVESFYSNAFLFAWPPEIVSLHLGRLVLSNPAHAFLAGLELGPVFLAFPLTVVMGWKAIKRGHWYQAAFWTTGWLSLMTMFVLYTGSAGIGSTTRFLEGFINVCKLGFVPLLWAWARDKNRVVQFALAATGLAAILGGVVHFGVSLTASAKPVSTFFLTDMDAKILANHWNRFEEDALVFDPEPVRGVTVLGRYSFSSLSWGEQREEWRTLLSRPDPYALRSAGFSYLYYDIAYWEALDLQSQEALASPCVQTVERVDGYRSEKDYRKDFRLLADISRCK